MVAKVTISLPEELLEKLDAEASSLGRSRSFVAQEAMVGYLGKTLEQRADDARRARIGRAIEGMRDIAARNPHHDGRPSVEILREIRETGDSSPPRGESEDDE